MDMVLCSTPVCSGCGLCVNICPNKAISMKKGKNDFLFPEIDIKKCSECGLCRIKCPALKETEKEPTVLNVYAAWNKDKQIRNQSTSGGVFSLFANSILKEQGMVVGVSWDNEFGTEHIIIDNYNDIDLLRGSKYVQSNVGIIYTQIKERLLLGKKILFSGTPCQNHALKIFLGKDYPNLTTIDLVCHGVPSREFFRRYLKELEMENGSVISKVKLRYKNPYHDFSNVKIDFANGQTYIKPTVYDSFFELFNKSFSLRESCHSCKYTNLHRFSDITLADFWGYIPQNFKMRNFNRGISLIIVNTKKGQDFFDIIKDRIVFEKSTIEKAIKGNKCLKEPFQLPQDIKEEFWKDYNANMSIAKLYQKYIKNTFVFDKLLWLKRLKRRYGFWFYK